MSAPIDVKQNPDGSWTAKGGTSLTVVSVTAVTEHKAAAGHAVALSAIQAQGKGWINCSDRLPAAGVVVLASGFRFESCGGGRWVEPVIYDEGCFHPLRDNGEGEYEADFDGEMNEVTHWQPLPSPPTE